MVSSGSSLQNIRLGRAEPSEAPLPTADENANENAADENAAHGRRYGLNKNDLDEAFERLFSIRATMAAVQDQPPTSARVDGYTGKYGPAGRFLVAVARGQLEVVQELYEEQFATAKVKIAGSLYTFCGSSLNTNEDPATGTIGPTSCSGPLPGESALDVARKNDQTRIVEYLQSHDCKVK